MKRREGSTEYENPECAKNAERGDSTALVVREPKQHLSILRVESLWAKLLAATRPLIKTQAPLGIKVGDRETRDIPDIFALHPDEVLRLQDHDPARARVDHAALSDDRLTVVARNREATALYAWEPYFHDAKLRGRLHRIDVPTLLLWGAEDRFVAADAYGAAYRDAIAGACAPGSSARTPITCCPTRGSTTRSVSSSRTGTTIRRSAPTSTTGSSTSG
jgi:pimeloyl-ACP methyl ester carboxylesterase